MNPREHAGADHREDGHRFSRAVDRGTPVLLKETENRGDQRTGVPDTYPPNKVCNIPTPPYGSVEVPGSYSMPNGPENTKDSEYNRR